MRIRRLARVLASGALAALASLLGPGAAGAQTVTDDVSLTPIRPPIGRKSLAPNLAAGPEGIFVTWVDAGKDHALRIARWDGAAWTPAKTVAGDRRLVVNEADAPVVAAFADGSVALAWGEPSRAKRDVVNLMASYSPDGGRTWTPPLRVSGAEKEGERGFASFLDEGKGRFSVVWLDGTAGTSGNQETALTVTPFRDGRFGEPRVLDPRVCDCCETAAVRTSSGWLVAYRDRSENENRDTSTVLLADGAWSEPRIVNKDWWTIPACPVNGPAVAAEGAAVAVAWFTAAKQEPQVKIAFSTDGGKEFGAPVRVDLGRPAGRVDVQWLPGGWALVSWLERTDSERVRLLASWVTSAGQLGEPIEIASLPPGGVAAYPRMARRGVDVFFAWTEGDENPAVRLVRMRGLNGTTPRFDRTRAPSASAGNARSAKPAKSAKTGATAIDEPARDFQGTALDGKGIRLADFRGRVVLLSFFGTWCPPCRREIPEVVAMRERLGAKGFEVLAVSAGDDVATLQDFVRNQGIRYPVLRDRGFTDLYGVTAYPTNVLVDRKGRIRYRSQGYSPSAMREMEGLVKTLLDER